MASPLSGRFSRHPFTKYRVKACVLTLQEFNGVIGYGLTTTSDIIKCTQAVDFLEKSLLGDSIRLILVSI